MDEIDLMGQVFLARRRQLAVSAREFGITLAQLGLIRVARRRGAISPSDAAAELFCDRPTATVVARNCLAKGLLLRKKAEHDGRSSRLALSGEGEELLDRLEAARTRRGAPPDPLDALDEVERSAFVAALKKVHARAMLLYGAGEGGRAGLSRRNEVKEGD